MDPESRHQLWTKRNHRTLFLPEKFIHKDSVSSSELYICGKLSLHLLSSDTWRQSSCQVASSSWILSFRWAIVALLRSWLKRRRGLWSGSNLSKFFSIPKRELAVAVKFSLQYKDKSSKNDSPNDAYAYGWSLQFQNPSQGWAFEREWVLKRFRIDVHLGKTREVVARLTVYTMYTYKWMHKNVIKCQTLFLL